MPVAGAEIVEKLSKRLFDLEDFMRGNREVLEPQKHLDTGSNERVYWHAGYASALRDLLNLLSGTRTSAD